MAFAHCTALDDAGAPHTASRSNRASLVRVAVIGDSPGGGSACATRACGRVAAAGEGTRWGAQGRAPVARCCIHRWLGGTGARVAVRQGGHNGSGQLERGRSNGAHAPQLVDCVMRSGSGGTMGMELKGKFGAAELARQ